MGLMLLLKRFHLDYQPLILCENTMRSLQARIRPSLNRVCVCVCARVRTCPHMRSVTQSSPTLCYSRDCSQSHQSMEFSRQEYWSRLIFPTPGDLPKPGIKLTSLAPPALEEDSLLLCPLEAVPQPYHYPKFRLPTSRTTRKKLLMSVSQLVHGILLEQPLAD